MKSRKIMMVIFMLGLSLTSFASCSNFIDFSEQERKEAIEVSSGVFTGLSEENVSDFIRGENLDILTQGQESAGTAKHRFGLSIDGGGIRGVMPALWLQTFKTTYEDEGEVGINAPLYKVFDYVGGTSIGGIIALGVAADLAPDSIVKIFEEEENRKKIFPTEGRKLARFIDFFGLFGYRYTSNNLEALLREQFGEDVTLNSLKTELLVTACTADGHPWIFKKEGDGTKEYKLWEVARSTSAAPTYFPSYTPSLPNQPAHPALVDGGIWLNNPSTLITASIVKDFHNGKFNPNNLHILSLGTGDTDAQAIPRSAGKRHAGAIIEALMNSHSRGNHMVMTQLLGDNYHRINPKMTHFIDLSDTSPAAFTALQTYAEQETSKIGAFVEQTKELIRHKLEES